MTLEVSPATPNPRSRGEDPGRAPGQSGDGPVVASVSSRRDSGLLPTLPGYEIFSELGRAGMGVVYKARQLREGRIVAVKMLRDGVLAGGEQFERFCNEAQILANLRHPNVVQIIEVGEHEGRLYMALEFAEGGNLAQRLARQRPAPHEAAALIESLARAAHHVHQHNIIHRDLKPANVLLTAGGTPKIADFGLGKRDGGQEHTATGAILGTPSYMSPEQAQGKVRDVGPTTDVYSLGAILYECLTGHPPFKGATILETLDQVRQEAPKPPRQLCPGVSPELEAVCLKCLEKEAEKRYATAEELADELARARAGRPLRHTPLTEDEEDRRRRSGAAVAQGMRHLDAGALREALVWFIEALKLDSGLWEGGESDSPRVWREEAHRIRLGVLLRQMPRLVQVWLPASPATRAEFTPDGRRLVAAGEDGTVRILDLDTARVLAESPWHQANVNRLSFSADGRRLVSASDDGTARVWDTATGEALSPPLRHKQWVTHAAFSPDGRHVVTGSVDGSARVWDWKAGETLFPPVEHGGMLWSVGFSPTGAHFVTAGWNGLARLWDARLGCPATALPMKHGDAVRHTAFSPDGLKLATASDDLTARVWSVASGRPLTWPLKHHAAVRRAAFSQDGQYLLTWTDDGAVRVWDAETGAPRPASLSPDVLAGGSERSPEGRRQLECGRDGTLRLWDWASLPPEEGRQYRWGAGRAEQRSSTQSTSGEKSPDSSPLTERADSRSRSERTTRQPAAVLCTTPDGRLAVTATGDGHLRVWDMIHNEAVTPVLSWGGDPCLRCGLEEDRLVLASEDGRREWDLSPDPRPVEDLVRLTELLAGCRLDGQGNLVEVGATEVGEAWRMLREAHPGCFSVAPEEVERWHESAARACESAGLWAEAVAHLEVLQRSRPSSALLWGRRARLWARAGRGRDALHAYAHAIECDEGNWSHWYGRGLVHYRLGHWHRAGRDFARAAGLHNCWQAWYRRGLVQVRLRRFRAAASDFKRALKANPDSRTCLVLRACLHAHFRRWAQAAADYDRAWELGERRPWALYQYALVCLRLGQRERYAAVCQSLLALAEKSCTAEAAAWAAWACVLGGWGPAEAGRVLALAERVQSAFQESGGVLRAFSHTLTGAALLRAGRAADAVDHLHRPPGPGGAWDWLLLVRACHALGDARQARQWLHKTLLWLGGHAGAPDDTPLLPPALPWHQRLEIKLLRRQAEALFRA